MRVSHAVPGWPLTLAGFTAGVIVAMPAYSAQTADALCGSTVQPEYAALNAAPIAQATHTKGDVPGPAGASCFTKADSAAIWITVASVIHTSDTWNALIGRFGAIAQLLGVQYWSTTEQKWRPLVSAAYATDAASSARPRRDYSAADLASGEDRYYEIADSRSERLVTYRLRLRSSAPGRVVLETANVDPIKKWGITFYPVEGLHTWYFLEERAPAVWSYYSITRVLPQNFLAEGHDKSYINRAVALYRHYAHLPTNAEPPSAP